MTAFATAAALSLPFSLCRSSKLNCRKVSFPLYLLAKLTGLLLNLVEKIATIVERWFPFLLIMYLLRGWKKDFNSLKYYYAIFLTWQKNNLMLGCWTFWYAYQLKLLGLNSTTFRGKLIKLIELAMVLVLSLTIRGFSIFFCPAKLILVMAIWGKLYLTGLVPSKIVIIVNSVRWYLLTDPICYWFSSR